MVDKITGSGGARDRASVNLLNARVLRIVRNEKLLTGSDYNSVTSRAVSFGNQVYLIRDHHTALIHWARALGEGKIGYDSALIHIDAHPDLESSMTFVDKAVFGPSGYPISQARLLSEAERITRGNDVFPDQIPEEQFIEPAIDLKIVSQFVNVYPDGTGGLHKKGLSIPRIDVTLRELDGLPDAIFSRPPILDIDLDFFDGKKASSLDAQIEIVIRFMNRVKPGIVTIAFSPASSDQRHRYLSLAPEECVEVISRILIQMGLDDVKEAYFPEPRRTFRESGK